MGTLGQSGPTTLGVTPSYVTSTQDYTHGMPAVTIPLSAEGFLLAVPLLQQHKNVSEIVKGMQQHLTHRVVQERACQALLHFTPRTESEDYDRIYRQTGAEWQSMQAQYSRLAELGVIQAALHAMSAHPDSSVIAETGCNLVFFLTRSKVVQSAVAGARGNPKEGIMMCIINAMSRHILNNGVQASGCKALYNLSVQHEPNGIAIIQAGGLARISSAMQTFPADTQLQRLTITFLRILSESSVFSQSNMEPVIGCILRAMHVHAHDNNLQVLMAAFLCLSYHPMQCLVYALYLSFSSTFFALEHDDIFSSHDFTL